MDNNDKTQTGGENQAAPEMPDHSLDAGDKTPAPEKTPEEVALNNDEPVPGPDDKVVPFESIAQKNGAEQGGPENTEAPTDDEKLRASQEQLLKDLDKNAANLQTRKPPEKNKDTPAVDKPPAQQRRGRPPKGNIDEKKPKKPIDPEYQKALDEYQKELEKWNGMEEWERQGNPPVKPKPPRKNTVEKPGDKKTPPVKEEAPAPAEPELPPVPRDATREGGTEAIVYVNHTEVRPFKDHPFEVNDDAEMRALVESIKSNGVIQPGLLRPHPDGNGYELICGHRRQKGSELAGTFNMPYIIRKMTDEEAILAMTDDNLRQRENIPPSVKAKALKMQVDAVTRQGARDANDPNKGKTAYDIVAQRNTENGKTISGKQIQRYVAMTRLVPDLMKWADAGKLGFTTAVDLSYIKPANQNLIAVSIDSEQSCPSPSQAKRMKDLDGKNQLTSDIIDGILSEEKKEEIKVIISGKELEQYFGKDKTPQQMKEHIMKLLDEDMVKSKTPPVKDKPER